LLTYLANNSINNAADWPSLVLGDALHIKIRCLNRKYLNANISTK